MTFQVLLKRDHTHAKEVPQTQLNFDITRCNELHIFYKLFWGEISTLDNIQKLSLVYTTWKFICFLKSKMTRVGFEPTPRKTRFQQEVKDTTVSWSLVWRLRPLGHLATSSKQQNHYDRVDTCDEHILYYFYTISYHEVGFLASIRSRVWSIARHISAWEFSVRSNRFAIAGTALLVSTNWLPQPASPVDTGLENSLQTASRASFASGNIAPCESKSCRYRVDLYASKKRVVQAYMNWLGFMLQYLYSETTIAIHKRKREDWVSRLKKSKWKIVKKKNGTHE